MLDSTPLYDAVATMDTVTLVRSAIRGLLKAADAELAAELRAVLARDDDYAAAGKPVCDYDDAAARVELVDALARDATALLAVLHGRELAAERRPGRRVAGHRGRPGPRPRHRRGVPDRPPGRRSGRSKTVAVSPRSGPRAPAARSLRSAPQIHTGHGARRWSSKTTRPSRDPTGRNRSG